MNKTPTTLIIIYGFGLSAAADGMRSAEQVCRLLEARQVSDSH